MRPEGSRGYDADADYRVQEMMIRLDERSAAIQREIADMRREMATKAEVQAVADKQKNMVTSERLRPLERGFYFVLAAVGAAVIGALMTLVFKAGH